MITWTDIRKGIRDSWVDLFKIFWFIRAGMYKSLRAQGNGRFESYNYSRQIMKSTTRKILKDCLYQWPLAAYLLFATESMDRIGVKNFVFAQSVVFGFLAWFSAGRPSDPFEAVSWVITGGIANLIAILVWARVRSESE